MNIAGDTRGVTFSGDTAIVPDTVEFIEPFSDSLIITIAGNTARITFPDTVIIAVDSTKPPSNPASTAVFGGARLTMRNYKSSSASRHEWTYYLLGGTKEQLSVWQGTQTSEVGFCGSTRGDDVYFYPTEYLTYGGRSANITTRPDGTQEYRIADHLGSNRVTLENTGSVVTTTDYEPFGKAIAGVPPRKGFIDKEKDQESGLGDFGVRKYDDEIGRFTSPDPLWEKYRAWSPYSYSANNPVIFVDPNGREIKTHREIAKDGTVTIVVTVTGKLINNSSTTYTAEEMQGIADRIASSIANSYTGEGKTVKWRGVANISVATDDNPLTETDHAFRLYDNGKLPDSKRPGKSRPFGVIGHAPKGERVVELNAMIVKDLPMADGRKATLERTAPHELGHSGTLDHPADKSSRPGNLMHQTSNPNSGSRLDEDQILELEEEYMVGGLNKGRQEIK